MKTSIPVSPPPKKGVAVSAVRQKSGPHIRLPLRSDKVEGDEADIGAVSSDARTASQEPAIRARKE